VTLDGVPEGGNQAYVKGGKYRLRLNTVVHEECDISSAILGQLRKGMLVYVNEVKIIPRESGAMVTRMLISSETVSATGWVSATDSSGQKVVDSRDHLEYEKLMRSLGHAPLSELPADPQHLERRDDSLEKAPTPPEPAAPPDPPSVTKEDLPGQAEEEQHAEVMQCASDRPSSGSREVPNLFEPDQDDRDAAWGGEQATLEQAHHKSESAPAFHPQQRSLQDPYILKRPWGANSGYRPLSELEEGADDARIEDNLDQENANYACCRAGFLSCGGLSYRRDKVKTQGNAPNGFMGGMSMHLGEPAPEPRPMRQLPSPPAFHATAMPTYT